MSDYLDRCKSIIAHASEHSAIARSDYDIMRRSFILLPGWMKQRWSDIKDTLTIIDEAD